MKQHYLLMLLLFATSSISAQDEQLLGTWVMDSIFDFDILLENPASPIIIEFNNETSSIVINGFCGETYQTPYIPNAIDNAFDITQTSWNTLECGDQGFEEATYGLLSNSSTSPRTINYVITQNDDIMSLELSYTFISDGVPEGPIGFFTKVSSPPPTIYGDWYLNSTNVQGTNRYNAQLGDGQPKISFTSNPSSNGLEYTGQNCNDFSGNYVFNSSGGIHKIDFSTVLVECDDDNTDAFKMSYTANVLGDANSTNLSFQIVEFGANEVLVLTNSDNSNYATFGRQPQNPDILGQWFLYSLEIDSNPISNPSTINPTINFTTSPSAIGFYFDGSAICTGYAGNYYFNPQQTFTREDGLTTTLGGSCDTIEEDTFESLYFYELLQPNILDEFDYSIIGTGDDEELVITNLSNGNKGFYGRQPLTVDDSNFGILKLTLTENPVTNTLHISNSQDVIGFIYEVYSIAGKRVLSGRLNSDSVDVEILHSGLYILKVSTTNNQFETVKFIKY